VNQNQVLVTLIDDNSCDNYTVTYIISNGGCLSTDQTNLTFIGTADNFTVFSQSGNTVCNGPFIMNGSFPGCGATGTWTSTTTSGSGSITFTTPSNQGTVATPSGPGTYQICYSATNNSPCADVSACETITVLSDPCVECCELGPHINMPFCNEIPEDLTFSVDPCAADYTYTWTITPLDGGATPIFTQPNGPTLSINYPLSTSPRSCLMNVDLHVSAPDGCTDFKRFRVYCLPDLSAQMPTIGLGCQGNSCLDLRDYVDYGMNSSWQFSHTAIIVDAPLGSTLQPNIGSSTPYNCVDISFPGTYQFDLVISLIDALTGYVCEEIVPITINMGDPGNINAGQDITTCETCTELNGNAPNFPVNEQWVQIGGPNTTTFTPANGIGEDVDVCGLDNTMIGAVYTYEYSWDAGAGCVFTDQVTITIDECDPCDDLEVDIETCCGVFDGLTAAGKRKQGPLASLPPATRKHIQDALRAQYGSKVDDAINCDPCVDGYVPIWAVNSAGTPYLSPYQVTWTYVDPISGLTVTIPGFVILAEPNIEYTVTVCNEDGECCGTETITFECCDLESISLDICVNTRQASCDPCNYPNSPFQIWVQDQAGNILTTTAGYTFLWNTGNTTHVQTGMINTTYSVTVTDLEGCTFTADFIWDCCDDCVEINTCVGPNATSPPVFTAAQQLFFFNQINQYISQGLLPVGTSLADLCRYDPCRGDIIFAWLEDCRGNLLTSGSFTWIGSDGSIQSGPTALLQANVTYTVTWTDADGCQYGDKINYQCCNVPPTTLWCKKNNLLWSPVPGAVSYTVYATPYVFGNSCCPAVFGGVSTWATTTGVSINEAALNQPGCFLWRVVPVCADGTTGPSSPWICCNSIPSGGGGLEPRKLKSDEQIAQESEEGLIATGITGYLSGDLKVTPNPSNGLISLEGYSVVKGSMVRLFDVLGQLVHSSKIQSEMKHQVDLTTLYGGNYLLVIETPNVEVPARSWITIE